MSESLDDELAQFLEDDGGEETNETEENGQGQGDAEGQEAGPVDEGAQGSRRGSEGDVEPPARPARRENDSVRALRERAQAAEARALVYEQMLGQRNAAPQLPQNDPVAAAAAQAAENERIMNMMPHEQAQYFANRAEQRVQQQIQALARQQQDALDRMHFDTIKATNKVAAKYESQVEKLVAEQAARGVTVPRKAALAYVLGEAVLARAPAAAAKQRQGAAERTAGATVRRGSPGGDTAAEPRGNRGNDLAALERRLAGKII